MADRASGRGWHGGRGDDGRDASAYERALGAAVDALHPRLRAHFAPIPAGQVGVGAGERRMTDVVRWRRGHFVDALGAGGDVRIAFRASVVDGALELHSTATNVRILGMRLRIPSPMATRVRLAEVES